jgi:hypothetical protein
MMDSDTHLTPQSSVLQCAGNSSILDHYKLLNPMQL